LNAVTELPRLQLKRNEERRIRHGHCWVYSNEVDTVATPLKQFEPGQPAELVCAREKPLGVVLVNPNALICARILSRELSARPDPEFFRQRIGAALRLREMLFDKPYYRLVYGDSDGLSGLVIDRFDDVVSIQSNTAGIDRCLSDILAVLDELIQPRVVVLRNDSSARDQEHLPREVKVIKGALDAPVTVIENNARFEIDILGGQKTGWFYDHRMARERLAHLAIGQRMLDVFSYVGGWGIEAAVAGAESVLCVDASAQALEQLASNARLNNVEQRVQTRCGSALDELKALKADGQRFSVVVLDPPAFIKRRKDIRSAEQAYYRINEAAMGCLEDEAILVSASCSMHLETQRLQELVASAAHKTGFDLQILEYFGQSPDHPVHPAIAETRYLKTLFCRLRRR